MSAGRPRAGRGPGPAGVAAFSLLLSAASIDTASAYRPFDGTDAHVAGPHLLEIEAGPLGYLRTGSERFLVVPETVVNFGTGSGFELALEGRGLLVMSPDPERSLPRIDDASFVAKKVLRPGVLQERPGPSIATEEALLLPQSGEHRVGGSASLIVSQQWEDLGSHLNAAVLRSREQEFAGFASIIADGPERWPVRPAAELSIGFQRNEPPVRGLVAGLIWQTRQGLTLDAAVRIATGLEHELELRSGFTWKMQLPPPKRGGHIR